MSVAKFRRTVERLKAILSTEGPSLHYTEVAYLLDVDPVTAMRAMRALAHREPSMYKYEKGYIMVKVKEVEEAKEAKKPKKSKKAKEG